EADPPGSICHECQSAVGPVHPDRDPPWLSIRRDSSAGGGCHRPGSPGGPKSPSDHPAGFPGGVAALNHRPSSTVMSVDLFEVIVIMATSPSGPDIRAAPDPAARPVALVTGATAGIGLAFASALAAAG